MAKLICTIPSCSGLVSGIKFVTHEKGMISEEVSDEVAAEWSKIAGFKLAPNKAEKLKKPEPVEDSGDQSPAEAGGGASPETEPAVAGKGAQAAA